MTLSIQHISPLRQRMLLRVDQGKGRKHRSVLWSPVLLAGLPAHLVLCSQ